MTRTAMTLLLGLAVACAPSAAFPEDGPAPNREEETSPEALAREGVEKFMEALRQMLESIPRYGLPHVNENGDIVIPRLDPEEERPDSRPGENMPEQTST